MAFVKHAPITPVSIGAMEIALYDPAPGSGETQRATVAVQVVLSDGSIAAREFNLADHVTAQVITQLRALAADLRTRAQAILP